MPKNLARMITMVRILKHGRIEKLTGTMRNEDLFLPVQQLKRQTNGKMK